MNCSDEIERLWAMVTELTARVRELERDQVELGEDAIGFEVPEDDEEFDSDETEYVTRVTGLDGEFNIDAFMACDRIEWNYFGD